MGSRIQEKSVGVRWERLTWVEKQPRLWAQMTTITVSSEGRKARDRKRDGKHRHLWIKLGKEPGSQLMNEKALEIKQPSTRTVRGSHGEGRGGDRFQVPRGVTVCQ